jgi:hypothetical protein
VSIREDVGNIIATPQDIEDNRANSPVGRVLFQEQFFGCCGG